MQETVTIFKALSEEIRLRILLLLLDGELCVCDLMEVLDLPQSTVSRHLSYLRNAGWVAGRREGVWMHYRLSDRLSKVHLQLKKIIEERLPETDQGRADLSRFRKYQRSSGHHKCS